MSYVLTFVGFAALIILHEAGHFVAAKAVGMRVERFSLFFGRTPLRFQRGETEYGIGWIPLGGFVKITGMSPVEPLPEQNALDRETSALEQTEERIADARAHGSEPAIGELVAQQRAQTQRVAELREAVAAIWRRAYVNQPPWKRIVVILAGPFVNVVIAFGILFVIYVTVPQDVTHDGSAVAKALTVGSVERATPAAQELKPNDTLIAVNGKRIGTNADVLIDTVNAHKCAGALAAGCTATTPVRLTVRRAGKLLTLTVYPRYNTAANRMLIGFGIGAIPVTHQLGPIDAAHQSVDEMWTVTSETVSHIAQLFKAKDRRQLHSIVGVSEAIQQSFAYDTTEAFWILALISLSLAIVNLFPFLPLDGGHIFWAVAEKLRGRRIPFSVMERAGVVGFLLIIMLFVVGLSNDLSGNGLHVPH